MSIITAHGLEKRFYVPIVEEGFRGALKSLIAREKKTVEAVKGISFSLCEGSFVGFVGPNGAGKSTTIKIISGIMEPTSGEVNVCGVVPYKDRITNARNIGVVFGQRSQLWWDIPVLESYALLKRIYEISATDYRQNLSYFCDLLSLDGFMMRPARQLSLGERMRADIAAAFLHNPRIVYLDEPTIGLDHSAKQKMRDFCKQVNQEKKTTILLTTHDMQDIEELSKQVIIINQGKIVYDGTIPDLRKRYDAVRIVRFYLDALPTDFSLGNYDRFCKYSISELVLNVTIPHGVSVSEVIRLVIPQCSVIDMNVQDTPIENVIEGVYKT